MGAGILNRSLNTRTGIGILNRSLKGRNNADNRRSCHQDQDSTSTLSRPRVLTAVKCERTREMGKAREEGLWEGPSSPWRECRLPT